MKSTENADPLYDPKRAALYIGLKNHNTLAVWRSTKRYDLKFIKVGGAVRYRKSTLDKFLEDQLRH
jgi:hypothetical protein